MSSIRATQLDSSSQINVDEISLRPFLEEIKKRCLEDLKINTIMVDDDNSGWKAFTNRSLGQWNTIYYVSDTLVGREEESCQNF